MEDRALLATFTLFPAVDGYATDTNFDGVFDTVNTTGNDIQTRTPSSTPEERGLIEFDLSQIDPSSTIISATLTGFVSSAGWFGDAGVGAAFWGYAGDGTLTPADTVAPATLLGSIEHFEEDPDGAFQISISTAFVTSLLNNSDGLGVFVRLASGTTDLLISSTEGFFPEPTLIIETAASSGPPQAANISLSISPLSISETDGASAATGTVTRDGDLTSPLVVNLTSSDTSEATVPATVTIAAGQAAANFAVTAVNDGVTDGFQNVTITATVSTPAGPLTLDPAFGSGGVAQTTLQMRFFAPKAAMAVQPDGKVVAAGEDPSTGAWRVTRFNADGTLDTAFGAGGVAVTPFGTDTNPRPRVVAIQSDGKILVGGELVSDGTAALARYNANGTLDTTFGTGGIANLSSVSSWIEDIAVQPDGKILLSVVINGVANFRVVRLNANGQFDFTFNGGSALRDYLISGRSEAINLLPGGGFLLAGGDKVARFHQTGELDVAFGVRTVDFGVNTSVVGMEVLADGRIVLGYEVGAGFGAGDFGAARLNADGTLDTTFSGDGKVQTDFPAGLEELATSMTVQPDGRIIVGGFTETSPGVHDIALVRYDVNGNLDSTFDGDGRFNSTLVPNSSEWLFDVALSGGKIAVLGGWGGDFRVARYVLPGYTSSDSVDLLVGDSAQTIVVDTLVDEDDGNYTAGDLSLREAVTLVATGGTITFASGLAGGTITLGGTQILLNRNVTITGPVTTALTISGNNASRIFLVDPAATVELSGLTLTGGRSPSNERGGAIENRGTLTLTNMVLTGNSSARTGGAIVNLGTLTISGGTFTNNTAPLGGAIQNLGTLTVSNSTFSGNTGNSGAAIQNVNGTLVVSGSTFSGNVAVDFGGAIENASPSAGLGRLTITDSTLSGNRAGGAGGGLFNGQSAHASVVGVTVTGNHAGVGGGVASIGMLTMVNSTLSTNTAEGGGGGLLTDVAGSVTHLRNVTIFGNEGGHTAGNTDTGGGYLKGPGGTVTLHNTLIAGNRFGSSNAAPDDIGNSTGFSTNSNNLIGVATPALTNGVNGNIVGIDWTTVIDPVLRNNGGPTMTHALLAGGAAVNAGNNAQAIDPQGNPLAFDQRGAGFVRRFGSVVDIGAFELQVANAAPVAVDDTATTNEDTAVTVSVLANDTDGDGNPLSVSAVTQGANGAVVINPNGTVTYTPNANFHGSDTFTYTISDGNGGNDTATVTVTVNPINDAPVANSSTLTTDEDRAVDIDLRTLVSDVETGDNDLVFTVSGAVNGTVQLLADGHTARFTPNANYFGPASFQYNVTDTGDGTAPAPTVMFNVTYTDSAGEGFFDSALGAVRRSAFEFALGIWEALIGRNYSGETINIDAKMDSMGGSPTGAPLGFAGSPFTWRDFGAGVPGTFYGNALTNHLKGSDHDPTSVEITATFNTDVDNSTVLGTNDWYYGLDANPGSDIDFVSVVLHEIGHGLNFFSLIGASGAYNNGLPGIYDRFLELFDGTDLTAMNNSQRAAALTSGDLYWNGTAGITGNGGVRPRVYAPSPFEPGSSVAHLDETVHVNEMMSPFYSGPDHTPGPIILGMLQDMGWNIAASGGPVSPPITVGPVTVNVTVNPVNDTPLAAADAYSTNEDTALTVAAPGVLGNDTDVDGDALTAVLVAGPANGSLTLNANGSFTYTPNANFNGTDTFTYKTNDGTADSGTATVTITVNAVNDAPVAANDSYSTNEDTALTVAAPGVLSNDADADGNALSAILLTGPANGGLTLNANGSFTYTPNANFNGTDTFTYKANDGTTDSGTATVTITVNAVNDAPIAANDSYSTNEDAALTVAASGVLGNDSDVEGNPLTAILVAGPASGALTLNANGSFTYTPNANFNGTDSFTYKANDGTADSNVATVTITVNAVNDAPVATNDSYSTNEDAALTVPAAGVLANDADVDGDPLTAILVAGPASGTLTLNANGSFTYTPNANFNGTDSFTYKANDGTADSNVATVTITVNAVNDAPVARDDSYGVDENQTLTVAAPGVLSNDTDVDGNPLTAVLVAGPANGTLTLNANGSFTYTPNAGFNGTDTFTYKANDGSADSNVATVTIAVGAVNDAPVAVNDAYATNEDTALVVAAPGVLGNDTDLDGNPLTAVLVAGPANGTLTLNANGSFTYTPGANFNGTDSFTYKANDGTADSNVATVTITVNAVNDAPVAANDSYTTNEDTALTVPAAGVLANDTDVDGNTLTAILVAGPANGTLTLSSDGSFTYTPGANFNGTDSFTYKANDGTADSNVATVTITVNAVNDAPVAANDSYSTNEDTALNLAASGVLGNDSDVDGNTLTAILVAGPANGTLTLNANGSFTYTPSANFNGTDSFTYKANDGTADSNVATVTITVNAVNDVPVAASDSYSTNEDAALNVAAPGVLANDTDVDGNPLTAMLVAGPASGTLTLNSDGSFTYTPNANFNGTDSFTYKANDGSGDSNVATVTITVNAVNDAPVAANDSYTTNEDTALTVAAPGVLGNDTDVDGNPLTAALVAGPSNGTLTLNADGSFTYTPGANFNGTDSFTYKANDGTADGNVATVTITVNAVNDAPVAADDNYGTNEDTPLTINAPGVLGNDSDVDGNTLTAILVSGPSSGTLTLNANGSFTYTPNAGFNATDTFTYKANDGTADSNVATVTISVGAVNDAPVATNDAYSTSEDTALVVAAPGVLGNDTDADGNTLAAVLVSGPASGTLTLNANGSFTYTPSANFNGTDSFTYKANDGTADSNVATVTITVNAVNDAPVAANDSYSTNEDAALTVLAAGVLANDTDVEGNPLTAVLVSGPSSGTLTLNANGSFTYTPGANFNGTDSFTYKANDGTADSNVATVTITVNAVNDAPVAANDSYSTNEDTALNVSAPGVLGNDSDVDGNTLTALLVSGPSNGALTLNSDGSFTYAPNANFNGTDSFTYKANDGAADSGTATVTITVNAVNDAPVAANDSYSTNEDAALAINAPGVLGNDTDVDGNPLTAILVAGPANGTLTLNGDGSFTYTPGANFNGSDSFTYKANDGTADSNVATVTITVNAVNDAPVAANDSYSTNEDTALTIAAPGVLSNDADVDGNTLTAVLVSGPSNGTLTLNANGSFIYTPNANFNGTDSFTYKANDGTADSGTATVTIAVNAVNDAPVAANDSYTTNEDTALTVAAPGVLANDGDVEGNALTAVLVSGPSNGSLTLGANGSFTYTPNANFNGTDSFTYKANDGTADGNTATVTIAVNPVNDAPVAADDSYTVAEDTVLTVSAPGVLGNDSDVDGDALTAVLVSGTSNGTLTLSANGSFTYTPNLDFIGTDSFTYRASDGSATSGIATVTITVGAANDAPVAANDAYATDEDTVLTVAAPGALGNDSDADGDTLTAVLVAGPSSGTLTLNGNGSFTYTPNANFHGTDSFTYRAGDGTASSNIATVTITVRPVNDAPVAANDAYSLNEDGTLNVPAAGVLANDSDVDGDALTAILVSGPSSGTLTLNTNGSFTYTPGANFNGTDSFTYKANDGAAESNVATVTITVNAVNDAPVAANDSYSTNEDTALTVPAAGVLANDADVDGNPLTAVLVAGPANGTLTLNANGSFTYTPGANFNGTDSFTYKANDGTADSNVATVTITVNAVNDAPVAVDDSYSTNEDTALTIIAPGVLANDSDVDGNPLTAILVAGPANGTLALNANGSFTYTPNAGFSGTDTFTYKANDGTADSNVATVTISVGAVNDAPVAANDAYSTNEDTALVVAAPGVLGNDSDLDGNPLTAILVSGPASGTLTLNANGSFTYTPSADFNGTDSFTYKANDGTADSNVATVTITVNAANDAPAAVNDSYSTNEDTALTVPAAGVLANDTDIDGNPLTAVLVSGPSSGTLTLNSDGSFTYTPGANFNGTDSFTYKANDGASDSNVATVTITVNAVNDAPVAANDSYVTDEDTPLTVAAPGVLGNDADVDGNPLTAILVAGPAHGALVLNADGSFTYTPGANFNGADSFTYKANDGTADSSVATVTITVNAVNDAPVAANDSYSTSEDTALTVAAPGVLGNDSDADGNPLTAALVTAPSSGTLVFNADGSFTYTPNTDFTGTDSFTYRASDGTATSNVATVTIAVGVVNDAPVAANDSYATNEDVALTVAVPGVLANDTDADGNTLTAVLLSGPASGTLTLNADGSFTYTPNANFNGTDSFTYKANDGTADSNVATVTITVDAVNDAPVAANDSYSTNEDTALTIGAPGVLGNDSDVEGGPLTAILVSGPSSGTLALNADGSFTYTPGANFNGTDSFTYKANDGAADSNVATVTIAINAVNDAPVAANDAYSTNEDTPLTVAAAGVLANDGDVDGDPLTAVLVTGPANGTLTLNADGSFAYTPGANFNGTDSFTYRAGDGSLSSGTATVTITVSAANDAPVSANDAYATDEDTPLTIAAPGVLANDTDVESSTLTAVLVSGPAHGALVLNADGSFTYTPGANFNGTDSFTYRANDGSASGNTAVVTISVGPVNDAPVATDDSATTDEDTPVVIPVLTNDVDVDGDALTVSAVGSPANGTAALNPDGTITYTPNSGFLGTDSFTCTVSDGNGGVDTATVSIVVEDVPDVLIVQIDIDPGKFPNIINTNSNGKIDVAILSTSTFDATTQVDPRSLTFGRTGGENSLFTTGRSDDDDDGGRGRRVWFDLKDVNKDGRRDLVVKAEVDRTGFQVGDTVGILRGETFGGLAIEGQDSVQIKSPGGGKKGNAQSDDGKGPGRNSRTDSDWDGLEVAAFLGALEQSSTEDDRQELDDLFGNFGDALLHDLLR